MSQISYQSLVVLMLYIGLNRRQCCLFWKLHWVHLGTRLLSSIILSQQQMALVICRVESRVSVE